MIETKEEKTINDKSNITNDTLKYYNSNADKFADSTVSVNFADTQNRFVSKLSENAYVLDFGCGSGRDTKYFLERGLKVDAIDGSRKLCDLASKHTGIHVKQMLFQELSETEKYEGIWACSSILHLTKSDLHDVFLKMIKALNQHGIIYTSFKYGEFEGNRNGRHFIDFTLELFLDFISDVDGIAIEEYWITGDVRPGREEEKWLNMILRKISS